MNTHTYFIIEIQAYNDGTAAMPAPLGFQVSSQSAEDAMIARFFSICAAAAESPCDTHTVEIVDSAGAVWRGYKQILQHGREIVG